MIDNKMKASDISELMGLVYENVGCLSEMGVQVMFLSNSASATVELSAFKTRLKTTSIIVFPHDLEEKTSFLKKHILSVVGSSDPYEAIVRCDREYRERFVF